MKKVKRRRFSFKRFLSLFLILYFIGYLISYAIGIKIKNIFISGENILSEQEILELGQIDNYPSCFLTTSNSIRKKLLKDPYIKDIKITKSWFCVLNINLIENKPLFRKRSNDLLVLENGTELENKKISNVPILINHVPKLIYNELLRRLVLIDESIISKISEVEYKPNDLDDERFLLAMDDGNYVCITLSNFDSLNYYLETLSKLGDKKGILYLDLGSYLEIIDN